MFPQRTIANDRQPPPFCRSTASHKCFLENIHGLLPNEPANKHELLGTLGEGWARGEDGWVSAIEASEDSVFGKPEVSHQRNGRAAGHPCIGEEITQTAAEDHSPDVLTQCSSPWIISHKACDPAVLPHFSSQPKTGLTPPTAGDGYCRHPARQLLPADG